MNPAPPPCLSRSVFLALLLCSGPVPAQEGEYLTPRQFLDHDHLTGNWGGQRDRLEERGIHFDFELTQDLWSVITGGRRQESSGMTLLDAGAGFDLEKLAGWRGQEAYARLGLRRGAQVTDDVGAAQPLDNLEGDEISQITELWWGFESEGGEVFAAAGKIDAERVFGRIDSGAEVLHSAAGFGNAPLPFFPDAAMGALVDHELGEHWRVALGIFNAQDGGLVPTDRGLSASFEEQLLMLEVGYDWAAGGTARVGRGAIGVWHHTGSFDAFDGGSDEGTEGVYLYGEQELWRGRGDLEDAPGLTVHGQLGWNDEDVLPVDAYVGGGARLSGWLDGRPHDVSGVYGSIADLSDVAGSGVQDRELAFEAYHRIQVSRSIAVQPALQWIMEPGGEGSDAFVAGMRIILSL